MAEITEQLIVEKGNGVGRIELDNQARRNAMTFEMWRDLPMVLNDFMADDDVRVVVLSGRGGKAFCAGADISQFEKNRSGEEATAMYNDAVSMASNTLAELQKPTIAKIEGFCIGGGVGIALCCDLRIANDVSTYAVPAAKLGLGYGHEGLARLVDLVGPSLAKEIFFTARQFTPSEAQAMGLINRVVPRALLDAYVDDYATRIAENAPLTIHAAKTVIHELVKPGGPDYDVCTEVVDTCFASEDFKEGRQAFMEKRKPQFKRK
ncbi:MAG: enoyl-CoA hydratase [Rhodospirillaceae bacterium]|nr:enoyl-CoA hydratase [Rhodospirillaceae bacterium]